MLQNANSAKTAPPIFTGTKGKNWKPRQENRHVMALDAVRADISPLQAEPDLLDALSRMAEQKQTRGMVALFDGFIDLAHTCQAIENEPRSNGFAEDYMEAQCLRYWSKAYLVADFLKNQPVDDLFRDEVGRVLMTCALMMGHGMKKVAEIAAEFAGLPDGFVRPAAAARSADYEPEQKTDLTKAAEKFEFVAAQLMGPMADDENAVTDALIEILSQSRDQFCSTQITTWKEAAFILAMATGEIDGVKNGVDHWQDDAERRLGTFLYMIGDFMVKELHSWPGTRDWYMAPGADPRLRAPK